MDYLKKTIDELIFVLAILIYRKHNGIRMTWDEKIYFLKALLKKTEDVYIHYNITGGSDGVDMPPLQNMICYPQETSQEG